MSLVVQVNNSTATAPPQNGGGAVVSNAAPMQVQQAVNLTTSPSKKQQKQQQQQQIQQQQQQQQKQQQQQQQQKQQQQQLQQQQQQSNLIPVTVSVHSPIGYAAQPLLAAAPPAHMASQPHLVQPHPPQMRIVSPTVNLPQCPVRPSALPHMSVPIRAHHPRLPQSPIRHHPPLPTMPVGQRLLQQTVRAMSNAQVMPLQLPQQPSPGILPAAPPGNMIPFPRERVSLQPPGNLLPNPPSQQMASNQAAISAKLLAQQPHPFNVPTSVAPVQAPPTGRGHYNRRRNNSSNENLEDRQRQHQLHPQRMQQQHFSHIAFPQQPAPPVAHLPSQPQQQQRHHRPQQHQQQVLHHPLQQHQLHQQQQPSASLIRGRLTSPRGRGGGQGGGGGGAGKYQSSLAPHLQDHNYSCRPPVTPPPASPPPTALQMGVAGPDGVTPSSFTFGIAASSSEALLYSKAAPLAAAAPLSLAQRNTEAIKEAGVGPMTPLEPGSRSQQQSLEERLSPVASSHSDNDEDDGGEETETAPEEEDDGAGGGKPDLSGSVEEEDENAAAEDDDDDEGGEDNSITRCICDFLHDDGYMICCDKCSVWQHVVCMGLDRHNIPDEYLCEVCKPRPIDRKRAKAMQSKRKNELLMQQLNSSSSSEEGLSKKIKGGKQHSGKMKMLAKKVELGKMMGHGMPTSSKNKKLKAKMTMAVGPPGGPSATGSSNSSSLILPPGHGKKDPKGAVKKQYRKRKPSEKEAGGGGVGGSLKSKKKLPPSRRKSNMLDRGQDLDQDEDEDDEDEDDDLLLEPNIDASQQLRAWIDHYEEAVTNHYTPELRARLAKLASTVGSDLRPSAVGASPKCNISLKGNGVKILTASANVSTNMPIVECKGRMMLPAQYAFRASPNKTNAVAPHVFFYRLTDALEVVLDAKTYGNDARFCRRSNNANAELRHVFDKGSLHVFIVAKRPLEKNQEILLPPTENKSVTPMENLVSTGPLQSINADLREISKKQNGMTAAVPCSDNGQALLLSPEERPIKEKKKLTIVKSNSGGGDKTISHKKTKKSLASSNVSSVNSSNNPLPRKTRNQKQVVEEEDEDGTAGGDEDEGSPSMHDYTRVTSSLLNGDAPLDSPIKQEPPGSPTKSKQSPGKLGLPDNSGLIVGVNTINYDASSSLKNKAKSREERKMEMIMKAFEQMEKAEQQKKKTDEASSSAAGTPIGGERPASKRRRSSNSIKNNNHNNDSALDASSADEARPEALQQPKRTVRKKGRKSGPNTPQRRRSRAMSGGSISAVSESEGVYNESTPAGSSSANTNGPFRFPKTKKMMMSDWLQEAEAVDEDDVSANYLRGSRSPPGIATHLLRSTPHSPVKNVCSAKKRWLRQAISEDHSEEPSARMVNGSASPSEATPLKKRRLASYKDQAQLEMDLEEGGSPLALQPSGSTVDHLHVEVERVEPPPQTAKCNNSLKKKLLHNMVLEAVLDKAMADMLGSSARSSSSAAVEPKVEEKQEPVYEKPEVKEEQDEEEEEEEDDDNIEMGDMTPKVEDSESRSSAEEKPESFSPTNTIASPPPPPPPAALVTNETASPSSIRTPEPSPVFRSFFKADVSLEKLEAELEASRRQREVQKVVGTPPLSSSMMEAEDSSSCSNMFNHHHHQTTDKSSMEILPYSVNELTFKSESPLLDENKPVLVGTEEESKGSSYTSFDFQEEPKHEQPLQQSIIVADTQMDTASSSSSSAFMPFVAAALSPVLTPEVNPKEKPKEKRRVSLADYKRRRKGEAAAAAAAAASTPSNPTAATAVSRRPMLLSTNSMPASSALLSSLLLPTLQSQHYSNALQLSTATSVMQPDEGAATPTMDEKLTSPPPSLPMPPMISVLPIAFGDGASDNKKKVEKALLPVVVASPAPEPKRENLLDRLKNQFGLTVDEESESSSNEIRGGGEANSPCAAALPAPSVAVVATAVQPPSAALGMTPAAGAAVTPVPSFVGTPPPGDSTPELDAPPAPVQQEQQEGVPRMPSRSEMCNAPSRFSNPPHPPPSGFTPTQYPSYPSNYPQQAYPKNNPPHPPPRGPPQRSKSSSEERGREAGSGGGSRRDYRDYRDNNSPGSRGYFTSSSERKGGRSDRDRDLTDRDRSERGDRGSNDRDRDYRDRGDSHHSRDRDYRGLSGRARQGGNSGFGGGGGGRGGNSYYS